MTLFCLQYVHTKINQKSQFGQNQKISIKKVYSLDLKFPICIYYLPVILGDPALNLRPYPRIELAKRQCCFAKKKPFPISTHIGDRININLNCYDAVFYANVFCTHTHSLTTIATHTHTHSETD